MLGDPLPTVHPVNDMMPVRYTSNRVRQFYYNVQEWQTPA